jgi:hypothetical protein
MLKSRIGISRAVLAAFLVTVAFAWPGSRGEDKSAAAAAKRIDELIAQLGDDSFDVRERATAALVEIGKPALEKLQKAADASDDVEVRKRACVIIEKIDPGHARRAELAERRSQLRKEIAKKKGVDAKNWGEDITNPFTNLTDEGKATLKAQGVDLERLVKLKAVLLAGDDRVANAKVFVNNDPDVILVLGKGINLSEVNSAGPILAVEDARIISGLTGADFVWFVEQSSPLLHVRGAPLLVGPEIVGTHDDEVKAAMIPGPGWRRPDDFLKLPSVKEGDKPPPLAVVDLEKKKKKLTEQITAQEGVDTAECPAVANPFTNFTEEGKAKLKVRGVDVARLAKLKAVLLRGTDAGKVTTFINRDPDTVLVIDKRCPVGSQVFSQGPILAADNAVMSLVIGADLVWFVDQSFPELIIKGLPAILGPETRHHDIQPVSDDMWHGDYGWRRPDDFLKPVDKPKDKKD